MVRVVDRSAVEQDQVLVGRTAAHVEAARGLAHRLDARQRHDDLQGVRLAEDHRHILDHIDAHLLDAHLRGTVLRHALGGDDGALQGKDFLFHHDVERPVAVDQLAKLRPVVS